MGYHHLLITKKFGMKINKILGIVVLDLLLSGNAHAEIKLTCTADDQTVTHEIKLYPKF